MNEDFPTELLPHDTGLIIADEFNAEIIRMAPEEKLSGARRKAVTQKFARHAARSALFARDPSAAVL